MPLALLTMVVGVIVLVEAVKEAAEVVVVVLVAGGSDTGRGSDSGQ